MTYTEKLKGKRILIVDDEPDILEALEEGLEMCEVDKAPDFEAAKKLLDENDYDAAVLDIMGVNGYDILQITTSRDIPTLMLTAHALSPDNFAQSMKAGAHSYVPKERLEDIDIFLSMIIDAGPEQKGILGKWFERLQPLFERKFGDNWLEEYKGVWD